jgi:hypothetical protein
MNETEKYLYHLKQSQTEELCSRFTPHVAMLMEESRDLALAAWAEVGGARRGQALLEVLMKQTSDVTNAVEMMQHQPKKQKQQ